VIGVLNLYAGEAGFFKGDELAMLDQMAMDISFALEVNKREETRKKMEENLRWQAAFLRAQVDSALDGVLVVDADGKKILQNHRLNELFKIPPSIYNDRNDSSQLEFVAGSMKDPHQFAEKVNYLYSHPEEVSLDQLELVDGSIFERYSYPVRDKASNYYGRIWTFRDITERRRLEEQFRQSQKMEAIGQLTGGIAHDFNNLLAVIIGNLDLLERQIKDNEAAVKRVNTARNASLRGADLTRRLLAFSRQEALRPNAIDLNAVIQTVIALAAPVLGPEIQVITRLDLSPPVVFADASGLENALLNLVVNARDAMPRGGKLTIASELRTVDAGQFLGKANELMPGCYAFVTVSDTGHGMTKETAQRVFEPFFTTKSHGTGLGLAMVYGFFRQSGGTVRIYSEPGSGTTLSFFLPIAEEAAKLPSARVLEPHSPDGTTGTILIVDDEVDVLEVASTCLSDLGYIVLTATDGLSAIQVLEGRDDIGVLLTDILMPGGLSGVELAQRAIAIRSNIRVIYCSGFPADALAGRNLSLAEGSLLRKPYQRSELMAIVRKVLASSGSPRGNRNPTSNTASQMGFLK
ncbi:MAG: ATP-binding protein, partial [Candidatus Korobacteraceae bacterium]